MRRLGPSLLAVSLTAFLSATASHAQSTRTHHVRDAIRNGEAQQNGRMAGGQVLQLDIVLPLRDAAGLDAFLTDLYNPQSANYRHFLTPAEFTQRFGPTQADYDTAVNFAKNNGLTVTGGTRAGRDIQVSGRVSAIESAFHIRMNTYRHNRENRTFFSTDSEPTTNLPFNLWHISGLDNYSVPRPLLVNKNDYAAENNLSADGLIAHATTGSGPSGSFLGSDIRAAYYGNGSLTGAGQSLGLLEYYGTNLADLTTYLNTTGQTNNVPITLLSVDGTSTTCLKSRRCDDTEQELDITQALGMAPGLSSLVVHVGSSDTAIISAMVTHDPLPLTIGCSWGWTPVDPNYLDPYFKQMAAQGQSFFAASGDSSTWSTRNQAWPADDPYVISVGGTDLITAAAHGAWQSETAWVDSGGGVTTNAFAIPSWQAQSGVITSANQGSATLRNGPDVSANANFTFYTCSNQTSCLANTYGGTSFAAPMWAGYVALANEQLTAHGSPGVGFLNPVIYSQNLDAARFAANFHDVSSGVSGNYSAVAGYDLVTGWGSPNAGLMAALTGGATQPAADFALSASPAGVTATAGNGGTSQVSSAISNGFNGTISLAASNVPAGVTVSFNPASIAGSGSSTVTFSTTAQTTPGTYSVTITGTSGSLVHSTTVSLTVNAAAAPDFALSATPSVNVSRKSNTTAAVSTTIANGFNSAVSLSAATDSDLSVSFTNATIGAPGTGSSTLQIRAAKSASFGSHTITITANGGLVTHTTSVTVNVTR